MDAEKFFLTELSNMSVGKDTKHTTNLVFKDCRGSVLMYYERRHSYLYLHYDFIWVVLDQEFNLKYSNIQDLIKKVLFKHLNWKVKTPVFHRGPNELRMFTHLNWKRKNNQNGIESNEIRNISI